MSDYTTTRQEMGDKPTRDALIQGNLDTFIEDLIIEPPYYFFYYNNSIRELHLINLNKLSNYSISNCQALTKINLPDLEDINSGCISSLSNLEIIGNDISSGPTLPKLKYIRNSGISDISKLQKLNLPELVYANGGITSLGSLIELNMPKLEVCNTNFNYLPRLLTLELPSIKLLGLQNYYSPYQEDWNGMASYMFYDCSLLQTIDISSETLYLINLGRFLYKYSSISSGASIVNLIIRSKIIPYLQAFQVPMLNDGQEQYKTINIRVPFHLLNDYKSSPFWGSTNYLSKLLPIETINTEHSSSITIANSEIPYWATSNEITCTLNCDWTNNITQETHENDDIVYTVHKRLTPYLGTTQRTVTLSQQFGSQELSAQCTQTPIEFSTGYSVPDQTTWHYVGEWGTLQNPNPSLQPLKENHVLTYHDNYVYFTCNGFHDSNIEFYKKRTGIDLYHLINMPDECDYFKNSICIYFNGQETFDFYIVQNSSNSGNKIVVLPLDQYYPAPNTVPPLYSNASNNGPYYVTNNINDTSNNNYYGHYHKSTEEGVPDWNDALSSPYDGNWHRVRFTNLDRGPHFVRVIEYSTNNTSDKTMYQINRPIIAINKNYTYNPIQNA